MQQNNKVVLGSDISSFHILIDTGFHLVNNHLEYDFEIYKFE